MEPIKLINGGGIIPLDLSDFKVPFYRVDPSTLPPLPAGVTLDDLRQSLTAPGIVMDDYHALFQEIAVRTLGYLPKFLGDRDQFGYDKNGLDPDGFDRNGLLPEEADPMLDDRPRTPRYNCKDRPDGRLLNKGKAGNKGAYGQIVVSQDGTERTLDKCWYDIFVANETVPLQRRMSDDQIADVMRSLFPHRQSKQIIKVKEMRWRFNKGKLACQKGVPPTPERISYRYLRNGSLLCKTTTRGRPIKTWDLTAVFLGETTRS